ncbi:MAG: transcriptional regulator [Arcobacter sp.]|nr:transcriptional regulator [Arcobacter sp.]
MNVNNISCDLHDYIEVICMFQYDIEIITTDLKEIFIGKALDTNTDIKKREYIIIKKNDKLCNVPLDIICSIKVLTKGARFSQIDFNRK